MKLPDFYRGWYCYEGINPRYYAKQLGVRVCSNTVEGLLQVIDHHIADRQAYINSKK